MVAGVKKIAIALLLVPGLAGCGPNASFERGPVVLSCDGKESKSGLLAGIHETKRKIFRIDSATNGFETWAEDDGTFHRWEGGKLTVSPDKISFLHSVTSPDGAATAKTTVVFNRQTGKIVDTLDSNISVGFRYEGDCKVTAAPSGAKKF